MEKLEARKRPRGPKLETNSNDQNSLMFQTGPFRIFVIGIYFFEFVSDFDIRISDFDAELSAARYV